VVRVEHTVEIARSADEVFARLADVARMPEWQASAISSRADGSLAKGVRIHERRSLLGRETDSELEVEAFEPGRRLTLRTVRGPLDVSIDHLLEERDGRTRLHVAAEARPGGLFRLAGPAIAARARQELHRDLGRLKELLAESSRRSARLKLCAGKRVFVSLQPPKREGSETN
jgi:carbon monoxide dehydrogenase subunit G